MGLARITLNPLTLDPTDLARLQAVLVQTPGYYHRIQGAPAGPDEAHTTCTELPPGKTLDDKRVYGVSLGEELVGCVELILGYPTDEVVMLGLLLIAEPHQRKGLGRQACEAVEDLCRGWPGVHRVRIAVVETNAVVLPFWTRMGFTRTGENHSYTAGQVHSTVCVLEKDVAP